MVVLNVMTKEQIVHGVLINGDANQIVENLIHIACTQATMGQGMGLNEPSIQLHGMPHYHQIVLCYLIQFILSSWVKLNESTIVMEKFF